MTPLLLELRQAGPARNLFTDPLCLPPGQAISSYGKLRNSTLPELPSPTDRIQAPREGDGAARSRWASAWLA